jgi:hypothetical protein
VFNDTAVRFAGQWDEGNIISGKWVYPNGTTYEG